MHVPWKNCPSAWAGQYTGKEGIPTLVLEAIADDRTYIWHSFFGSPGSNNDININDRSPMWIKIAEESFPKFTYNMSHGEETNLYYAADNIYPDFPIFMKSCGDSKDPSIHYYSKRLEAVRKDVERAFGILQARFAFLKRPCLLWSQEYVHDAVQCCIILHNMIIEEEEAENEDSKGSLNDYNFTVSEHVRPSYDIFEKYLENIRDAQSYHKFKIFRDHLIEHLNNFKRAISKQ